MAQGAWCDTKLAVCVNGSLVRRAPAARVRAGEVVAVEIRIPKLGMEMTEAVLSEWLVDDGAAVAQDQPMYVLETDKVENEVGAPVAGTLHRIGPAGDTYAVGEVIGEIV